MIKKRFFQIIALFVFIFILSGNLIGEAAVKKVAIGRFVDGTNSRFGELACANLESIIFSGIVQNKNFEVVERSNLDQVLRELGLQNSGIIDGEQAIEIGQMAGSDYMLMGTVINAEAVNFTNFIYDGLKGKVTFEMHLVDNRTGSVLSSELVSGTSSAMTSQQLNAITDTNYIKDRFRVNPDNLIADACQDVGGQIIERMNSLNPLTGIVVQVNNKEVYLDLGYEDGVREKDKYTVYREGKPITNPVTGEIITVEKEKLAVLEIKKVQMGYSIAEIDKKKKEFKRGDRVERGE